MPCSFQPSNMLPFVHSSHRLRASCSVREEGLFDYVVVNDDVPTALKHLEGVAKEALAGKVEISITV